MPSTIQITCQGGCGRRLVCDAVGYDAWPIPNLCRECADRQLAEYHQQGDETTQPDSPLTEPHKELTRA